jgi:hypothetical protein
MEEISAHSPPKEILGESHPNCFPLVAVPPLDEPPEPHSYTSVIDSLSKTTATLISGGAEGADTAWAGTCLENSVTVA